MRTIPILILLLFIKTTLPAQEIKLQVKSYHEGETVYLIVPSRDSNLLIESDVVLEPIMILHNATDVKSPAGTDTITIGRIQHPGVFTVRVTDMDTTLHDSKLFHFFAYSRQEAYIANTIFPPYICKDTAGHTFTNNYSLCSEAMNNCFYSLTDTLKKCLASGPGITALPAILDTLARAQSRLVPAGERKDLALIFTIDNPGIFIIGPSDTATLAQCRSILKAIIDTAVAWKIIQEGPVKMSAIIDSLLGNGEQVKYLPLDVSFDSATTAPPLTLSNLFKWYTGINNISQGNFIQLASQQEQFETLALLIKLRHPANKP